jgi:uncharacterized protein (TIGR03435 family)
MNQFGLSGQGIGMADFARFVAGKVGVVAIDKTGLKGFYDFKVDWPPPRDSDTGGLINVDPQEQQREVIFAAVEQQAGLKFNPQTIPVQMLVIDSVERPSAN